MLEQNNSTAKKEPGVQASALDQSAIDRLLSNAADDMKQAAGPSRDSGLDQSAINKLLADHNDASPDQEDSELQSDPKPEDPPPDSDPDGGSGGALDQEAVNRLLDAENSGPDQPEDPPPESDSDGGSGGALDQEAVNRLLDAENSGPDQPEDPPPESDSDGGSGGALDQEAVNRLLDAENNGPDQPEDPPLESDSDGGSGGALDQEAVNRLLNAGEDDPEADRIGHGGDQAAGASATAPESAASPAEAPPKPKPSREEMDELIAELAREAAPADPPGTKGDGSAQPPQTSAEQEEMDRLIAELAKESQANNEADALSPEGETATTGDGATAETPQADAADGEPDSADTQSTVAAAGNRDNDFVSLDDDDLDVYPDQPESGMAEAAPPEADGADAFLTDPPASSSEALPELPAPTDPSPPARPRTEKLPEVGQGIQTPVLRPQRKRSQTEANGSRTGRKTTIRIAVAAAAVVLVALSALIAFFDPYRGQPALETSLPPTPVSLPTVSAAAGLPPARTNPPAAPGASASEAAVDTVRPRKPALPVGADRSHSLDSRLQEALREAAVLREQMLAKAGEILALQDRNRQQILSTGEKIASVAAQNGFQSLEEALQNKPIEFSLRSIQQRLAYVEGLNQPARDLQHGAEELLFISRAVRAEMEMARVLNGIDLNTRLGRVESAIAENRSVLDQVAIREPVDRVPFERIWKELPIAPDPASPRSTDAPESRATAPRQALPPPTNAQIWQELCDGDVANASRLSLLSAEAAQCLAGWEGQSLFLNGLTELTPDVAQALSQWHGNWLVLNGLTHLSPDSAKHLSRWPGKRLSLNGLERLSSLETTYLRRWKGKELELMSLSKFSRQVAVDLTRWKKAGGRVFVQERLKKTPRRPPAEPTKRS
jgi:hypothetical protein